MVKKTHNLYISDNMTLYDALSIVSKSNIEYLFINLDTIVDFIYLKTLMLNESKSNTRTISQLGTYVYRELDHKQIAKKVLSDINSDKYITMVYTTKYDIIVENSKCRIEKINMNKINLNKTSQYKIIDTSSYLENTIKQITLGDPFSILTKN